MSNLLNRIAFNANTNKFTIYGSDTCDSAFIASKLIEYFSNVGKTLSAAFDDSDDYDISLDYLGEPSHNLYKFEPVTEDFVRDLLLSLKDSSPG